MKKAYHILLYVVFLVYVFGVIYNTLLNRDMQSTMHYELQLFWSYQLIFDKNIYFWQEIVLNILLFLPGGILLPLAFKKLNRLRWLFLTAFCSSLCIELIQLVGKIGLFEFDDIFNNVLGALIGFGLYHAWFAIYNHGCHWLQETIVGVLPALLVSAYFFMLWFKIVY